MSKKSDILKKNLGEFKGKSLVETLKFLKDNSVRKFDETVDLLINLNINPKKTDQVVKGRIVLSKGSHKKLKVMAFVPSDMFEEAKKFGADLVGNEETINEIKKKQEIDCDLCVTTPDFISKISVIAQFLGKKGLMPSVKSGTVLTSLSQIQDLKNSISFRSEHKQLYVAVGKLSFGVEALTENIRQFFNGLKGFKPVSVEKLIKSAFITTTMGPKAMVIPREEWAL